MDYGMVNERAFLVGRASDCQEMVYHTCFMNLLRRYGASIYPFEHASFCSLLFLLPKYQERDAAQPLLKPVKPGRNRSRVRHYDNTLPLYLHPSRGSDAPGTHYFLLQAAPDGWMGLQYSLGQVGQAYSIGFNNTCLHHAQLVRNLDLEEYYSAHLLYFLYVRPTAVQLWDLRSELLPYSLFTSELIRSDHIMAAGQMGRESTLRTFMINPFNMLSIYLYL